jgi:hypothetical protein
MNKLADVIEAIRDRPELYISSRSINYLRVYLDGFMYALPSKERRLFADELGAFRDWLAAKYKISSNQSWNQIVLFFSPNEAAALDEFFRLFEEYEQ